MSGRLLRRAGASALGGLAGAAFLAALPVGAAGPAKGAEKKRCGIVCIYAKPDFKGRRVCLSRTTRTANIEKSWGRGFVPGSVRVARQEGCSPVAYFYTGLGYTGVVAAYFGTASNIIARRFRSFRLKHERLTIRALSIGVESAPARPGFLAAPHRPAPRPDHPTTVCSWA